MTQPTSNLKMEARMHKVRSFLQKQRKAGWGEIQLGTGLPPRDLAQVLRMLLEQGEVKAEKDRSDRRRTSYELTSSEQAKAEIERYQVVQFILAMENPVFTQIYPTRASGFRVTSSAFLEAPDEEEQQKRNLQASLLTALANLGPDFAKYLKENSLVNKLAIAWTFERQS